MKVEKALLVRLKIEAARKGVPIYALVAKLVCKAAPHLRNKPTCLS